MCGKAVTFRPHAALDGRERLDDRNVLFPPAHAGAPALSGVFFASELPVGAIDEKPEKLDVEKMVTRHPLFALGEKVPGNQR